MKREEELERQYQARREALERETRLGQILMSLAARAAVGDPSIDSPPMNPAKLSAADAARLADVGSKLVRLGLGLPTDQSAVAIQGQLMGPTVADADDLDGALSDLPWLRDAGYALAQVFGLARGYREPTPSALASIVDSLSQALNAVGEQLVAALQADPPNADLWPIRRALEAIGRADAWPYERAALPEARPVVGQELADVGPELASEPAAKTDHEDDQVAVQGHENDVDPEHAAWRALASKPSGAEFLARLKASGLGQ